MGLLVSCGRAPDHETERAAIRVVQLNGFAYEFMVPVRVKDVLLRHPHHFICSSHALRACDPRPLPPEEELTKGDLYFLLPFAALETQDLVSLASQLISLSKKLEAVNGHSVYPLKSENYENSETRNSEDCLESMLAKVRQSDDCGEPKRKLTGICDTPHLQMVYRHYVLSKSRPWTPGLYTIDESCFAY